MDSIEIQKVSLDYLENMFAAVALVEQYLERW